MKGGQQSDTTNIFLIVSHLGVSSGDFPNFATRCFLCSLHKISVKLDSQSQFWILLIKRIPYKPLHALYDDVLAKIFKMAKICRGLYGILLMGRIQNCHLESSFTNSSWRKQENIFMQNSGNCRTGCII